MILTSNTYHRETYRKIYIRRFEIITCTKEVSYVEIDVEVEHGCRECK